MKSFAERKAAFAEKKAELAAASAEKKAELAAASAEKKAELAAASAERKAKFAASKTEYADTKATLDAKQQANREEAALRKAEAAGIDSDGALMTVESHEDGRNSIVFLYPDRIERIKARSFGSLSKAHQDTEVIPIRQISSVQSKKAGIRTAVVVHTAGNEIVFRVAHDAAQRFKSEAMRLVLAANQTPTPETADVADRIRGLAELRDQGHLTDEEFQASKQKLLGL